MKKTYIIPEVLLIEVSCERLIAESIPFGDETATGDNGGWVKQDRNTSSREGHSVWDDDWSQQ